MLPSLIEYLEAATELGGHLAAQSMATVDFATIPPGTTLSATVGPPSGMFAAVVYNIEFTEAPPTMLSVQLQQGGSQLYNGVLTAEALENELGCYLVVTDQQALSMQVTNRDVNVAHLLTVKLSQLVAQTKDDLDTLHRIVGRMNTDTSDTQLLSDILSTLQQMAFGRESVPAAPEPISPQSPIVRRRGSRDRFWLPAPTGKGLFQG